MMNDECSQPEQMSMRSKSFAKTSGSKGLQVYLPLNTSVTYDETKKLSRSLAEYLEGEHVEGRAQRASIRPSRNSNKNCRRSGNSDL